MRAKYRAQIRSRSCTHFQSQLAKACYTRRLSKYCGVPATMSYRVSRRRMPRYTSGSAAAACFRCDRKQQNFSRSRDACATRIPRSGKSHSAAPIQAAHSRPTPHCSETQTDHSVLHSGVRSPQNRHPIHEVLRALGRSQPKTLSPHKTQRSEMSAENKFACVAYSTKFAVDLELECMGRSSTRSATWQASPVLRARFPAPWGSRDICPPGFAAPFQPAPTDQVPDTTKDIPAHDERQCRSLGPSEI